MKINFISVDNFPLAVSLPTDVCMLLPLEVASFHSKPSLFSFDEEAAISHEKCDHHCILIQKFPGVLLDQNFLAIFRNLPQDLYAQLIKQC